MAEGQRPKSVAPPNQRGFLSLGVMGYVVAGLVAALVVAGGVASCEHRGKVKAQEETARVRGEFDGFVAQVAKRGKEAEAEKASIEKRWKEVLANAAQRYQSDLAGRDAAIRRLRERPPARPDGGTVPIASCSPQSPDGTSGEFVSLAEYRELEARAYDDALRLSRLQAWVKDTGHPVE